MIEIKITDNQLKRAEAHYGELKDKILNGSITKGQGNIYGALGEIIVHDLYQKVYDVKFENNYDYDLVIDGDRVDVKTKRTTVKPNSNYIYLEYQTEM